MKIGILIDSWKIPQWKYKIIEELSCSESVSLRLIKVKSDRTSFKLNSILFYLYETLDYLLFSKTGKFKETQNEKDALKKVCVKEFDYQDKNAVAVMHDKDDNKFDLIVDLTQKNKKDFYKDYADSSKKGICFFEFGEQSNLYPAFFKEIYLDIPLINVSLSLTDGKYKKTLYKSCSSVYNFSLYLNNNKNFWKMSDFINRVIKDVKDNSDLNFGSEEELLRYEVKTPPNTLMIKFLAKIFNNLFNMKFYASRFNEQWFLAYRKVKENSDFINHKESNYEIISPPDDRFFADPFIVDENDKSYVFFEECCFAQPKGVISCLEINSGGEISIPKIVLEKDHHLSYPFVFKCENKYYMIPETLANKTIELYEAVNFPEEWQLKKTLFDNIHAVDTSLLNHNGKFWLFTNISRHGSSISDELYLFFSDSLFGEWKSHPQNPIISNTKTARPAGKLFYYEDKLIRPSQENSVRYGYALNFNHINILNENEYKETLIKTVKPHFIKDNLAIHTYNRDNRYNIIDGMRLIKK